MSSIIDNESEILLGNKQLLVVFAAVAVLLAVAFTGGYMLGKNSEDKKIPATVAADSSTPPGESGAVVTRTVPPSGTATESTPNDDLPATLPYVLPAPDGKVDSKPDAKALDAKVLDAKTSVTPSPVPVKKAKAPAAPEALATNESSAVSPLFVPQPGQSFLQVAAVGRDEADAVADVLHKKGFRAHSVQKPGNPKIYRVIIGPIKDAGDFASTRDALRKTGFREVVIQKY